MNQKNILHILDQKIMKLATKSAILNKAQRCNSKCEQLRYLIHKNWYESYSFVLVALHTKANLFERQEHV